ncbi:hypothetical protein CH247_11035 [Rhodococcus sp. 06-156-3b]|nr:hypothetical protein [Rhodococcus sp. 06-156-3b]OZD31693.1 hypothetical protein CH247_11035 [Rhodococcus sp. 06-156-3b]
MAITVQYTQASRMYSHEYEHANDILVQPSGALLVRSGSDTVGAYPAEKWFHAYDPKQVKG